MPNILVSVIVLFLFAAVGCSTTGRVEKLVVGSGDVDVITSHNSSVRVGVIGGDSRFVSSETFKAGLMQSLSKAKVFSTVKDEGNAQYELYVIIMRSENSGMGGSYYITSKWILRSSNGDDLWSELVGGEGSSAAFAGASRIRAASERASRDVIEKGIEKLGQVSL